MRFSTILEVLSCIYATRAAAIPDATTDTSLSTITPISTARIYVPSSRAQSQSVQQPQQQFQYDETNYYSSSSYSSNYYYSSAASSSSSFSSEFYPSGYTSSGFTSSGYTSSAYAYSSVLAQQQNIVLYVDHGANGTGSAQTKTQTRVNIVTVALNSDGTPISTASANPVSKYNVYSNSSIPSSTTSSSTTSSKDAKKTKITSTSSDSTSTSSTEEPETTIEPTTETVSSDDGEGPFLTDGSGHPKSSSDKSANGNDDSSSSEPPVSTANDFGTKQFQASFAGLLTMVALILL
ncbi:unnamed protein product [Ambrosiozyma monospora]|uniref:Unnamed protein product n=1 Tax=Ambrosiozyma monospora TaxID=43982 RepID=A0ACB5SU04_AMBMO|nr:unnamed protein product [Ambrosiozyma monospora]